MPILKMDSTEFVDIWYGSRSWPVPVENTDMKTYTPEQDVEKKLADGRTILVARKGVPVVWAEAVKLGLVKEPKQQQPVETKDDNTAENEPTDETPKPETKRGK